MAGSRPSSVELKVKSNGSQTGTAGNQSQNPSRESTIARTRRPAVPPLKLRMYSCIQVISNKSDGKRDHQSGKRDHQSGKRWQQVSVLELREDDQ